MGPEFKLSSKKILRICSCFFRKVLDNSSTGGNFFGKYEKLNFFVLTGHYGAFLMEEWERIEKMSKSSLTYK